MAQTDRTLFGSKAQQLSLAQLLQRLNRFHPFSATTKLDGRHRLLLDLNVQKENLDEWDWLAISVILRDGIGTFQSVQVMMDNTPITDDFLNIWLPDAWREVLVEHLDHKIANPTASDRHRRSLARKALGEQGVLTSDEYRLALDREADEIARGRGFVDNADAKQLGYDFANRL